MGEELDRRKMLMAGAGLAAVAAAATALPAVKADAATPSATPSATPAKKAIGLVGVERLWGYKWKYTYEYYYVKDRRGRQVRKRRTIKTKIVKTKSLWSGTDTKTLNKGGMCHWIGTAAPLANGNCVLFGHRTSAGGLLRNVHKVKIGDQVTVSVNGQGQKTYRVTELPPVIGSKDFASAINWGNKSKSYLTLVACTKTNRLPSSTKFRLLVRCVEV